MAGVNPRVDRLDLETGERYHLREIRPVNLTGVVITTAPVMTPDGKRYAFTLIRRLTDLFLVGGPTRSFGWRPVSLTSLERFAGGDFIHRFCGFPQRIFDRRPDHGSEIIRCDFALSRNGGVFRFQIFSISAFQLFKESQWNARLTNALASCSTQTP